MDFERFEPGHPPGGPDMRVQSVRVDGVPASFRFAQPAYPGDPRGPDDPDPRAHEVSQHDPVGGPDDNPLLPACSPELTEQSNVVPVDPGLHKQTSSYLDSQDGNPCPADKLVITPRSPIPDKPTYDFSITTQRGKTAIANGRRIASYLPLTIVGDYTAQVHTVGGRRYYQFQSRLIPAALRVKNTALMAMQPGITRFGERFSGPFPFPRTESWREPGHQEQ